ncbi:MAG: hypothetical protein AAF234_15360, partial [Pseudomonadota bacterium]
MKLVLFDERTFVLVLRVCVRHQGFWERLRLRLSERSAHLFLMLCGLIAVLQTPLFERVSFDPF